MTNCNMFLISFQKQEISQVTQRATFSWQYSDQLHLIELKIIKLRGDAILHAVTLLLS